jgi:Tol biopolymer transport system component
MNMWITTPAGDRWFQMTNFDAPGSASSGYTGVVWTPDGKRGAWAELVGNVDTNDPFGIWRLYLADFSIGQNGMPQLLNKKDITPVGAKWVEPGNFTPDGSHLLLSTDIGISNAQGQDQWSLDIQTGALQNLTNSPTVWDEHGLYSLSGKKIVFMSSYPYRNDPTSYQTFTLKTEFMLMDADGSHLQQLTHFNVPGYPESQGTRTVAAVAWFTAGGSQLYAMLMGPDFTGTNWVITFAGFCGAQ